MAGLAKLHPAEEMIRTAPAAHPAEPRSPKRSKSEIKRSTNSSGVSGVHFKAPNVGHPGYWLAITYTAGKGSVSKAFSIKEHGPDLAKQMAIEERERQLEQKLNVQAYPRLPAGRASPSRPPKPRICNAFAGTADPVPHTKGRPQRSEPGIHVAPKTVGRTVMRLGPE
jgi:hypothetical protein